MILLLSLLLALVPATPLPKALPYATIFVRLPTGLRIALIPIEGSGLAAYYTLVRTGSRNETDAGHTGFAHFFEHMMFRGTPKWPADKAAELLTGLGYYVNAYTSVDFTVYENYGPPAGLLKVIELEADRFQNLKYNEPEFQTEARAVLGEYNKSASNPELKLAETLGETAFHRHPYGHTVIGTLADIQAMPKRFQYSLKFFERHYRPDNCTIIVVGDFDGGVVMDEIRKLYGGWKSRVTTPDVPPEPEQHAERKAKLTWPTQTPPRILAGWRTPPTRSTDKNQAVAAVLEELLYGPASVLHADLVLGRQLVERFESWSGPHRDPFLFAFQVVLKQEKDRAEVLRAIEAQIAAIAAGKIDPALLADVRSNLRYSGLMRLDTPARIANAVARTIGVTNDLDDLNGYFQLLAEVTAEDVARYANTWLRREGRTLVDLVAK